MNTSNRILCGVALLASISSAAFAQVHVRGHTQAMDLLQNRHDEWRAVAGIDAIEKRDAEAYERKEKAWKGLITWAKSHPRDIPTLAHALHDCELLEPWRFREFLRVVGKGVRL